MSTTLEYTAPVLDRLAKGSLNIQALKNRAVELWKKDQSSARELGEALVAVRDVLRTNHGEFTRWYRRQGLDENRVHYCMRLVEGKLQKARDAKKKAHDRRTTGTRPFWPVKVWNQLAAHARAQQTAPEKLVREIVHEWLKSHKLPVQ